MNGNMANEVSCVYVSLKQAREAVLLAILANKILRDRMTSKGGKVRIEDLRANQFGALIHGQSGVGKTASTDPLADILNDMGFKGPDGEKAFWNMLDVNLASQLPEEFQGLPTKGEGAVKYLPRYNIAPTSFGICRIDELDRPAFYQTLTACIKWAIDRTTDAYLGWYWFVLGLCNSTSDSNTEALSEHARGRFMHLYISTNLPEYKQEFEEYMERSKFSAASKRLMAANPIQTRDEFENYAVFNPRSLGFADAVLAAYKQYGEKLGISKKALLAALSGLITKPMALELIGFDEMNDLPDLATVTAAPSTVPVPKDGSLVHKHAAMLVRECGEKQATKLMTYLLRLQAEVARCHIETLARRCPTLAESPEYIKWVSSR